MKNELAKRTHIFIISHKDETKTAKAVAYSVHMMTGIEVSKIVSAWDDEFSISLRFLGAVIFLYSPATRNDSVCIKLLDFFKSRGITIFFASESKEATNELLSLEQHPNNIYNIYKENFFNHGFANYLMAACEAACLNYFIAKGRGDKSLVKDIFSTLEEYKEIIKTLINNDELSIEEYTTVIKNALSKAENLCEIGLKYNSLATIFTIIYKRTKIIVDGIDKDDSIKPFYNSLLIDALRLAELLQPTNSREKRFPL